MYIYKEKGIEKLHQAVLQRGQDKGVFWQLLSTRSKVYVNRLDKISSCQPNTA